MTQKERDRLVVLKKAKKKLITQKQAAAELGVSERQIRRMLCSLKRRGDRAVIHASRNRRSNRKISSASEERAMKILSQEVYRGFGPTLAAEYLAKRHQLRVGRETLRGWMVRAKLWRAQKRRLEKIHQWRERRSCWGELVQWDTSEHSWLEGRGPKLYLIAMIDDASSRLTARFVRHDSTEENMRLLWSYLESHGRPVSFYTDKASLFANLPKTKREQSVVGRDRFDQPPTQIGRALQELGITWIPAHSPQAKGRIERTFGTAQDRLVKGLRVAGASTLEQANAYLKAEFLPWWERTLTVVAANTSNAHRPLGPEHSLAASLSRVEDQTGGQRLHNPLCQQDLSDRTDRHTNGPARRRCASRSSAGRFAGSSLPQSLPGHRRMPTPTQSYDQSYCIHQTAATSHRKVQEQLDEKLSPRQQRCAPQNIRSEVPPK
jgi:biotin operon repressor